MTNAHSDSARSLGPLLVFGEMDFQTAFTTLTQHQKRSVSGIPPFAAIASLFLFLLRLITLSLLYSTWFILDTSWHGPQRSSLRGQASTRGGPRTATQEAGGRGSPLAAPLTRSQSRCCCPLRDHAPCFFYLIHNDYVI